MELLLLNDKRAIAVMPIHLYSLYTYHHEEGIDITLLSSSKFRPHRKGEIIAPSHIEFSDISIILPVKDNQKGINLFLSEFLKTHTPNMYPKEIIVIDNNSRPQLTIPEEYSAASVQIVLLTCATIGPACARNVGARNARGSWLLFTDSDCIPSHTFMQGYFTSMNGAVGYAGNVKSWGNDRLSRYYESQEILLPPERIEGGKAQPEYIVTANALVWKQAFEHIGGFNETIPIAAGEDIDLGFRLREMGTISSSSTSLVFHNFDGGLITFCKRFLRYGRGNKIVSMLYHIDLTPRAFNAKSPTLFNKFLAKLQYVCLLWGYTRR